MSPCKAFCLHDLDNFESATDPLALDDDIDGRMNEFADIGAGQITAAVAFLDQQCQLLKGERAAVGVHGCDGTRMTTVDIAQILKRRAIA